MINILRGHQAQWLVICQSRVQTSSKAPVVFFEQECLPLLLSTGWFQEWIGVTFHYYRCRSIFLCLQDTYRTHDLLSITLGGSLGTDEWVTTLVRSKGRRSKDWLYMGIEHWLLGRVTLWNT